MTSGGITYLVDRLVEKALAKREECAEDRRARYAALTPAGTAPIKKIFPQHTAAIESAVSGLTLAEQREAPPGRSTRRTPPSSSSPST